MTNEPLGVCEFGQTGNQPHFKRDGCMNWRPVEAGAPRSLRDPQRLWDMVRFMRSELFDKQLVTMDEYDELAKDHAAVARLEADDAKREASAPAAPPADEIELAWNLGSKALADWMIAHSFATGHGDHFADLLNELGWQVKELRDKAAAPDAELRELRAASRHLANEVAACTGMEEPELRHLLGNTNFNCLVRRMNEVRELLDRKATDEATKPGDLSQSKTEQG